MHEANFNIRPWVKRSKRKPTRYEGMRAELPYGVWREADGAEVLFTRDYHPIWRRAADGSVSRITSPVGQVAPGRVWIHWVAQNWFFNDSNTPWHCAETRRRCEAILRDWHVDEAAGDGGSSSTSIV